MHKLVSAALIGAAAAGFACSDSVEPTRSTDPPGLTLAVSVSQGDTTWTDFNENGIADEITVLNHRICYGQDACGPMPSFDPVVPTVELTVNGVEIDTVQEGDSVLVEWVTTDADTCTASGAWSGTKACTGEESLLLAVGAHTLILDAASEDSTVADSAVVIVEAVAPPVECTLTVNASAGAPDSAVNTAQPGDVVCLVGEFTLAHTFATPSAREGVNEVLFDLVQSGTSDSLIVIDGSQATIVGDFDNADNVAIQVNGSFVHLTHLSIETGFIIVGAGASDVRIDSSHVSLAVFPNGNAGLIRTLGGTTSGASNIVIEGNVLEDVHGCFESPMTMDPCEPESALPWDEVGDVQHLAGIYKQGANGPNDGSHIIRNNVIRRVPSLIALKRESDPPDYILIENNTFADAIRTGQGATPPITQGNTYDNVGDCGNCWAKDTP